MEEPGVEVPDPQPDGLDRFSNAFGAAYFCPLSSCQFRLDFVDLTYF